MRALVVVLAALSTLIISASHAREGTAKPFEGVWESCGTSKGERICRYDILKQKADRICGLWHHWASSRDYGGRLIADAEGLSARVKFICGSPGSETNTECPGEGVPFASFEWQQVEKPWLICDNRLFDAPNGDGKSCADIVKSQSLPKLSNFALRSLSEDDRRWLKACLDDAAYPPPDLRK
jgi:hypothetical protein